MKKKIILPVDGSDRALNTVKYVARFEAFHEMNIVLFHVFNSVPEAYWDLRNNPNGVLSTSQVRAWESQQKKNIHAYMQRANKILLNAGFPSKSVKIKIQNRKKGIARDIIREADNGYDAVIARRRGMTGMRGIILGSVATKLIEKLTLVPLILAGRQPPGKKILLPFDGSEKAMQTVQFVGSILGGYDYDVCLFHVIRGNGKIDPVSNKDVDLQLEKGRALLVNMGMDRARISTEISTGARSRAKRIAGKAKKEGFGSIAMGRRGYSQVRDFFIGRVTNKVIFLARDRSVWII